MDDTRRFSAGVRKRTKRKSQRLLRSLVRYLQFDGYLFAPLFSASPPPSDAVPGFRAMELEPNKGSKKKRMLEKAEEYLKSDYHLYGSIASPPNHSFPLKGEMQIANKVTVEVSTSTRIVTEEGRQTLRSSNAKWSGGYSKSKTSTCHHPRTPEQDKPVRRSLRLRRPSSSLTEGEKLEPNQRKGVVSGLKADSGFSPSKMS